MPAGNTECGNHSCTPGYYCGSRDNCLANGSADCGNGSSCPAGNKCARDGKHCLAQDTVDCGNHFCSSGQKCGSGNACLAQGEVDCGGGRTCPAGNVCVKGTPGCMTRAALAERAAEEAALAKRLKELPGQQKKEDSEATAWLKNEQSRLVKEAEARKAAAAQAANQQLARSMTPTQFDQKWCPMASIMTYGAFSGSEISNQRRLCAKQDLTEMAAIKGNCARVEVMAGCGCYTVAQVQAEAAKLGCSGYSTSALTLLNTLSPPASGSPSSAASSNGARLVLNPSLSNIARLQPPAEGLTTGPSPPANRGASVQIAPTVSVFTSYSPPPETPNLWDRITGANEKLLTSGPGQILTDTLQAAGDPFADKFAPKAIAKLGDAQDLLTAANALRRGDILGAAESAANYSAVTSSGYIGATLMPQNPELGAAAGQASAQFVITTWKVYGAPVVGDELVKLFPNRFIPAGPVVFH